jgi:HK97 family phage major capsid protein
MSSSDAAFSAYGKTRALLDKARREGRDLTQGEKAAFEEAYAEAEKSLVRAQVDHMGEAIGVSSYDGGHGVGDQFVASKAYKAVQDPDARAQNWTTGPVPVGNPMQYKGTLLESTAGGPGGGAVPAWYEAGVNSKLFEPLGVADLFGQSQTPGSQVRYVNEGTALSGAAGVAEAALKPESTIGLSEIVEPVKKIATLLGVSDEMLSDAPPISSYLNERLTLFVKIEEERQLLRGNGTNELIGLFNRAGAQAINQYTKLGTDDNAVSLARVVANTAGSANLQPDGIIMHPTNWLTTRLLRDGTGGTIGQFYGGGPFTGAYGNAGAANVGMFGQSLWGLPVALSTIVGPGTALVGNFRQGAHIWRRGALSVEASNAHSDWFARDLVAVRAEQRLALGLYRPAAVTEVRGLT